jgi:ParB family chromosome partitioning protein
MRFEAQEKAARTPLRSSFADDETGIDPDEDEDTDFDAGDDAVIDHKEAEEFNQAA